MTHPSIKSRIDGPILFVTIARPEKRNALTPEMIDAISAAVCAADEHEQVRAVIVHGEGPMFSAGVDINSLGQMFGGEGNPARGLRRLAERLQARAQCAGSDRSARHRRAARPGDGLGSGIGASVRPARGQRGLPVVDSRGASGPGGRRRWHDAAGAHDRPQSRQGHAVDRARRSAQEALGWGLVNRVVPAAELLPAATALAGDIMKNAPLAVGLAKLIVDQGDGLPKLSQMAIERWAQSQLITTGDVGEAFQAFVEKRPPKFRGS